MRLLCKLQGLCHHVNTSNDDHLTHNKRVVKFALTACQNDDKVQCFVINIGFRYVDKHTEHIMSRNTVVCLKIETNDLIHNYTRSINSSNEAA